MTQILKAAVLTVMVYCTIIYTCFTIAGLVNGDDIAPMFNAFIATGTFMAFRYYNSLPVKK